MNVTIMGTQWGDEGKGKIVDSLSAVSDVIVRFQGGHNAGHTLCVEDVVYRCSLIPSGIIRKGKWAVIGNGVVLDPVALLEEIATLNKQGVDISPKNLFVSELCSLVLDAHRDLDQQNEGEAPYAIGTTKRGIGPAYEDRTGRRGIRLIDLKHTQDLEIAVERFVQYHNTLRPARDLPRLQEAVLIKTLKEIAPRVLPYMCPVHRLMKTAMKEGKKVLFEGAQGFALDVDHGTHPYVTSSNTLAAQAAIGAGVSPQALGNVLGITKAYSTRVGDGPFPTELHDAMGKLLGEKGKEFGTVTQRRRRCGWFDAVLVRQAVEVSGVRSLALTKLDILQGLDFINVCVGYQLGDTVIDYFPPSLKEQAMLKPIYEKHDSWQENIHGVQQWKDIPEKAVRYIRRLEELVGVPITIVSTGPDRQDTIMVRNPFEDFSSS